MHTLLDVLQAILFVGIPVGVFSFLMIYFSYQKGYLSTDFELKDAFKKNNNTGYSLSRKHKKELLFLHSKWVTFGGGFYGLIALLTFLIIELTQVVNFLFSITGWQDIVALFSFDTLIVMIIDSITNMVQAIIWFTYWSDKFDTENFIVWIFIAYISYRFSEKYAMRYTVYQRKLAIEEAIEE
ncbi:MULTISPECIES: hypothetical protein [unclassified Colwellia]|uniref:hypothetical protein n=1 Tax=unclassified Colwellia TaxID=196834 RepID=UPI0015F754B6|nr:MULTISPECIES: hypothetical protein [unclassified Colwellia]MBA6231634.1 hypothetical protein [Colwellia sp. MB02u-7]MBA6235498.1 hypothetical protein [Colwellia sp. MB02u-11]MBA6299830.1 hypothetical protein [Colwellia sp. MB3u-22]MBA6312567.1 hypothetical protein [Colwellia sp. MB3u-64]